MMEVTKIVDAARDFREAARRVRPHPANPYTVDAKAVARFVDGSCAYVSQCLDDAATTLAAKEAELAAVKAREAKLLEVAEAFVATLTDNSMNEDRCLSFRHAELVDCISRARAALSEQQL